MILHILNGPNLNLVGRREPEIYGHVSIDDYLGQLKADLQPHAELRMMQSAYEGKLIEMLHEIGYGAEAQQRQGIVINPGGLSHTSVALHDAILSIPVPVVEVHISHVHARESFRQNLLTARAAKGMISGLGLEGYRLACEWLMSQSKAGH